MSSGGDFHITLPRNIITHIFDDKNTSSNFEIPLPTPLEFGETTFEVALTEIQFPHTWYNIPEEMRTIAFQWMRGGEHGVTVIARERKIPPRHYATPKLLVGAIDSEKPKDYKGGIFINTVNNLEHIAVARWQAFRLDKRLAPLLRFEILFLESGSTYLRKKSL